MLMICSKHLGITERGPAMNVALRKEGVHRSTDRSNEEGLASHGIVENDGLCLTTHIF